MKDTEALQRIANIIEDDDYDNDEAKVEAITDILKEYKYL